MGRRSRSQCGRFDPVSLFLLLSLPARKAMQLTSNNFCAEGCEVHNTRLSVRLPDGEPDIAAVRFDAEISPTVPAVAKLTDGN